MANYSGVQREQQLKNLVFDDFFDYKNFSWEQDVDNIDFIITGKKSRADLFSGGPGSSRHFLWAEAKKGTHDVFDMYTQLILTCKKTYEKGNHFAPPYLGCFDEARIAFVPFHDILPIFNETDFNWNTTPSNHDVPDFIKAKEKIKNLIGAKIIIFNFGSDDNDIKEFIKAHFLQGSDPSIHIPITKDNFVQIFYKWVKEVMPTINMAAEEWAEYKKAEVLECDFFRADIMSDNGNSITISDKLKIILENDTYKLKDKTKFDRLLYVDIGFNDKGEAYRRFWNRYERPPEEIYHTYIIDRRDLLVPQNIRERKGSFFTPKIWADKSKEYLAAVFGANWQDEYYIWDCAAGSGNLLAGLTNPYNVWASDIEQANIDTMKAMTAIDENLNLLDAHIFQFDFLNDILTKEDYEWKKNQAEEHNLPAPEQRKLPQALRDIIDDPEKRKKLIVYINPPYAEAANHGARSNKAQVTAAHNTSKKYKETLGRGINELFANFFVRIYHELNGVKLAAFSTLKYINSQNFIKFREYFLAEYKGGFICQAETFDNVKGKFPIGFLIWNTETKKPIQSVTTDVFIYENEISHRKEGVKTFYATNTKSFIIDWLRTFFDDTADKLGYMRIQGVDFQQNHTIFITSKPSEADIRESKITSITRKNLIEMCIYLSARQCIEATWLNDRDQFLFPNDNYKSDTEFQFDCLVFSLFHNQNHIQSRYGVNHWIPYTEKAVGAKEKFQSSFMSNFLKAKTLSPQAQAVLDEGRKLWTYYHEKIKTNKTAPVDASFYDIREFFQGRKENGNMNTKSTDETYNDLIKSLREALKTLAAAIEPKVYEYGFLKQ